MIDGSSASATPEAYGRLARPLGLHLGFSLLTLFPGRVGGSETYVRGLLGEFAAGTGPERVTVLANRHVMAVDEYGRLARGAVSLQHVRSYRPGNGTVTRALAMSFARALPRLAGRDAPRELDVVHFPLTVPIPEPHGPAVVSFHDARHHDMPESFSAWERSYRGWAYDGAALRATLVVTPSHHAKKRLIERVGVEPERVEVVHHGIDLDRFTPVPGGRDEQLLADLQLPDRYLLYPANLWPHKNHERLIEAFARQPDRDAHLLLVGEPYGRDRPLLARARGLGVEGRVRHLGFVPRDALPALYRRARAMIFPSLYEGFGSPPLEAMACGCPVASSTETSLAEVCGDAILPLEPRDIDEIASAMERVLSDEGLRACLRNRGLRRAAGFTWRAAAERHRGIYARAAETSER